MVQDPVLPDPETAILAVEIAKHDIWDKQHLPEHIRRFARTAHFKGNGQKLTPMNPFYPYLDDLGQDMEQAEGMNAHRLLRTLWGMRPMAIENLLELWREGTIGSKHVSCSG